MVDIDLREDPKEDSLTPQEETKEVQIGSQPSQITHLGTHFSAEEEAGII